MYIYIYIYICKMRVKFWMCVCGNMCVGCGGLSVQQTRCLSRGRECVTFTTHT